MDPCRAHRLFQSDEAANLARGFPLARFGLFMKTLLVVPDIFGNEGGIARIMRLYLKAICDSCSENDEIDFVALYDRRGDESKATCYGGPILRNRVSCNGNKMHFIIAVVTHGFRANRVICGHLHQLIVVWFLKFLRPKLRYYLVAHGIEVWRPYGWLERSSMRGAHRIFCVSEYTRRQMLRFDPALSRNRLVVLHNTYDPVFGAPFSGGRNDTVEAAEGLFYDQSKIRQPWLLTGSIRILVVSRLVATDPYKGVDLMIEAMRSIRQSFPKAQLRIVGGGDDRARLERLAFSFGVEKNVHFAGIIDDAALKEEYAACDVFALPSRKEGFGLVYLEAMSRGKPCVAARAGGAPEVVNEEVGALVEYGNVEQIAVAVLDILVHGRSSESIRRRVGEFAFSNFALRLQGVLEVNT